MPCCSSCGLLVQGHQIPTSPRCLILFDEAVHSSGMEPECTACQLPWSSHPRGKHIPKDCKFCHRQVQGEPGGDEQEHQEGGDVHARLSRITLENQAIKVQLLQLMELVHQLLPQPSHASVQSGETQAASTVQQTAQPITMSCQTAGLPSLTWVHSEIPDVVPGPLLPLPLSHARQQPLQLPGSPSTRAMSQVANVSSASRAPMSQPWASPVNTGFPTSPVAEGMTPVQVPMQLKGKIQQGEYVDLSELLVCDFQYRYSSLDDSQALEVVDGKLSLAPKQKARHLSNLQLWLHAWHIYEDTLLSFYPHRYMELLHYHRHISDLDQHFHWAAILSYDAQFRHKCALHNQPLSAFDQQLYVTILDATATKAVARRCFCCQRYDHEVIDCPFPPGALLEKEATVKKAAQSQQGWGNFHQQQQHPSNRGTGSQLPAVYHQGREICIKYQSVSCTFPNCRRAHVCRHCKQEHPALECHPAGPVAPQP